MTKRFALALVAAVASMLLISIAHSRRSDASQGNSRRWAENQALTRAQPTLATEGMDLANINGFRVSLCSMSDAGVGITLSGAGSMNAYLYNYTTGLWQRNPGLDNAVSVTSTSCGGSACRCQVFPDQIVAASLGARVLYAANAVTQSDGGYVDVRIDAWSEN